MSSLRSKLIRLAFENPELRGDIMPLIKEAGRDEIEWAEGEILTPHKKEIDALISSFLRDAQRLFHDVQATTKKTTKGVQGGDKVQPRDIEAAFRKYIEHRAGQDVLSDLLTKAIVHGDYIL